MLQTSAKRVALNNGSNTPVTGSSPRRKTITFSGSALSTVSGAVVYLANQPIASAADPGVIAVVSSNAISPYTLNVDIHGDCVTKEWHAFVATSAEAVCVIEGLDADGE